MTSRDRVIRALNHQSVDRAPRDLWLLHGMEIGHADNVAEMNVRFPSDFLHLDTKPSADKRSKATSSRAGNSVDAWGCEWHMSERSCATELVGSPLADAVKIASYEPPAELLESARFARANRGCEGTTRFTLAWSEARPLDRLRLLRGADAAVAELGQGSQEIRELLAKLGDFFRRELTHWAKTDVDGVVFSDDLGTPHGLRISQKNWRNLLKPLYRDFCEILHAGDKFVFFHSDGQISDLVDDLIEVGVDAIHLQWHLMDFQKLANRHRGRVTFWGEIDRKRLEPSGSCQQIRDSVLQVRRALDFGGGGVIAQCAWDVGMPLRNIATFFEEWMIPLPVNV